MDVILLDEATGTVVNVICADTVARAQRYYPQYVCVARAPEESVGPGDFSRDGGVTFEHTEA